MRLRICTVLAKWDMGSCLAAVLKDSPDVAYRETVARFQHAHARVLCGEGRVDEAKEQVALAMEAWREIRLAMLDDPESEIVLRLLDEHI